VTSTKVVTITASAFANVTASSPTVTVTP
jgi:hypothetical protein